MQNGVKANSPKTSPHFTSRLTYMQGVDQFLNLIVKKHAESPVS